MRRPSLTRRFNPTTGSRSTSFEVWIGLPSFRANFKGLLFLTCFEVARLYQISISNVASTLIHFYSGINLLGLIYITKCLPSDESFD
jgi:hypothetical protein